MLNTFPPTDRNASNPLSCPFARTITTVFTIFTAKHFIVDLKNKFLGILTWEIEIWDCRWGRQTEDKPFNFVGKINLLCFSLKKGINIWISILGRVWNSVSFLICMIYSHFHLGKESYLKCMKKMHEKWQCLITVQRENKELKIYTG